MAFFVGRPMVVGAPEEVHTSQKNPLGTIARGSDGYYYIYLQGVASTVAGDVVTFNTAFATARLVAGAKGGVAVALAAVDATTEYGWYGYIGSFTVNVASAVASNVQVYASGTAGNVDDTLVKDDQLFNVNSGATLASGAGTIAVKIWAAPSIGSTIQSA